MDATASSNNEQGKILEDNTENKSLFTEETIKNLSDGFVDIFKPSLEETKDQLKELTDKQESLIEKLHDENLTLSLDQNTLEVHQMIETISLYHKKLVDIKKSMHNLHDRNTKLKKRVLRLQQHKEKTEHVLQTQKNAELKREQDLIGRPNTSSTE